MGGNFKIKLSQLRILVGVADYGNFSEAALHLNLSQSAVSHAIATLEDELGVILLSRGHYGAVPTPVGERIIHHARQILGLVNTIVQEAHVGRGVDGGRVRIVSFRSAAAHIIPPVIAKVRGRYPKLTITLTDYDDYDEVEDDLRNARADIGFTRLPAPPEFETWELMTDEYIVLLPPQSLNGHGSLVELSWNELATYPLILSAGMGCSLLIRQHLKGSGFPFVPAFEVKEDSTAVSMVAQGLGAAILPRLAAEPIPAEVQVFSLPQRLERRIGVAVLANMMHSPAVYAFLDALRGTGSFAPDPVLEKG